MHPKQRTERPGSVPILPPENPFSEESLRTGSRTGPAPVPLFQASVSTQDCVHFEDEKGK